MPDTVGFYDQLATAADNLRYTARLIGFAKSAERGEADR